MLKQILALNPESYPRHLIHGEDRAWAETNCYSDIWIELLHAMGYEPIAALPFTLSIDFEGDQWTFFKFPLLDLRELYGLDVQELAVWRPLVSHIEEQVSRGCPVLVELDSFHLPDTAGTAYKIAHVKSTVAITEIDVENKHLGYFHGRGYYYLQGDDFVDVFHLCGEPDPATLPPYMEFVKVRKTPKLDDAALLQTSLKILKKHLQWVPAENPFTHFKARFERDLAWLLTDNLETFHQYSFATLRQYGACYELSATYLQWLAAQGEAGLAVPTRAFLDMSEGAKTFQFQLARAMSRRKPLDMSPLDAMAAHWETGMAALKALYLK